MFTHHKYPRKEEKGGEIPNNIRKDACTETYNAIVVICLYLLTHKLEKSIRTEGCGDCKGHNTLLQKHKLGTAHYLRISEIYHRTLIVDLKEDKCFRFKTVKSTG